MEPVLTAIQLGATQLITQSINLLSHVVRGGKGREGKRATLTQAIHPPCHTAQMHYMYVHVHMYHQRTHTTKHTNTNTLLCIVKYRRDLSNSLAHPNSDYVTTSPLSRMYIRMSRHKHKTTQLLCSATQWLRVESLQPDPLHRPPTHPPFCPSVGWPVPRYPPSVSRGSSVPSIAVPCGESHQQGLAAFRPCRGGGGAVW